MQNSQSELMEPIMPAFSYELGELRNAIEETKMSPNPFKELFVRIEAKYSTSRKIESGRITGMDQVEVNQTDDGFTIIGTGMATLDDLDEGQDAFVVRAKVTRNGNFAGASTSDIAVTDEDGTTYYFGSASSRDEESNTPSFPLRKGKVVHEG